MDGVSSSRQNDIMGFMSMLCGIAAFVFFLLFINIPLAVAAIVLGIMQIVGHRVNIFAVTGIIFAILSIVFMLSGWAVMFFGMTQADPGIFDNLQQQIIEQYQNRNPI